MKKVYTKPVFTVERIEDAGSLLGTFPDSFHADPAPRRRTPVF